MENEEPSHEWYPNQFTAPLTEERHLKGGFWSTLWLLVIIFILPLVSIIAFPALITVIAVLCEHIH